MIHKKDALFSAGELGQFNYCSVSWFLKRQGYHSPPSKHKSHGLIVHDMIGEKTHRLALFLRLSYYLIGFGALIISLILLLRFFGLVGW